MKPILFAGPSLYGLAETDYSEFELLPPAACGDVLRAVSNGARAIGLIDGMFENEASVHHKEILYALEHGVRVFGSSSMGALRAAECHQFGMTGIGRIFDQYRAGLRVADADVAVLHGPAALNFMPITVALVDAEATLDRCSASGAICEFEKAVLTKTSRALGFRDRTWHKTVSRAELPSTRSKAILDAFTELNFSQKREDAKELISAIRECLLQPADHSEWVPPRCAKTAHFMALMSRATKIAPKD